MAKRLDVTKHALMRFKDQKLFDRLIALHKEKLTSKVRALGDQHKKSRSFSMENVLVPSSDDLGQYFHPQWCLMLTLLH